MVHALPPTLDEKMISAMNAGYASKIAGNYALTEKFYLRAWELYPEPKYDWDSSQITLYSIADFYLEWRKFDTALEWANKVFLTGVISHDSSPYVVIGKIHFEAGNLDQAYKNFENAYALSKKRVFEGEDKKYLVFYLVRASGQ